MLKPKSSESLKLHDTGMNSFVITYINDYGATPNCASPATATFAPPCREK